MPTLFTHAAVGFAATLTVSRTTLPRRFLPLALLCSMLSDADVLAFTFGLPYAHPFSHRGFFHSLFFAAVVGLGITTLFFRETPPGRRRWWFYFSSFSLITALHGLLDAMTNGGLGIALLAPFNDHRYFFEFRPIAVSPIAPHRFFTSRGMSVVQNELLWVWLPALTLAVLFRLARRTRPPQTS